MMKAAKNKKLTPAMEDYLEAVATLKESKGVARAKDISRLLAVKAPSVTSALEKLAKRNLVIHEPYGYVDLSPEAEKLAKNIQKKHNTLVKFLTQILNIDSKTAGEDACRMEHSISSKTLARLLKFIKFVENRPGSDADGPYWLKSFSHYYKTGKRLDCQSSRNVRKTKK